MYNAISAEERGVPAVAVINEGFVEDAHSAASSRAMPGVRFVPTTVPPESTLRDVIEKNTLLAVDAIVKAAVTPLTDAERSPAPPRTEQVARLVFKGNLDDVNRFYYQRGWTDGFPIVPPTEDRVAEMLTGTDLAPDTLLGTLIPRLGKVTVEKVAVNAVMAGALPTHLPLILAGTQLLLDSEPGFQGLSTFGVSTGSWAPFWVVNGPVRGQVNLNCSSGVLSPGNIANAAIGRALGFIIKNLGGIRKGIEDMGVMGNPMKYTAVMAENEEESPWEPLHTEYGMNREDSTLMLSFPQSYVQHYPPSNDEDGIMLSVLDNLVPGFGATIMFPPLHAKMLASYGWTKQDIRDFICEYKRVPAVQRGRAIGQEAPKLFKGHVTAREGDTLQLFRDPRVLRVLVAGGPGSFIAHAMGGVPTPGHAEIQKITFPKDWEKLVKKYRNVVPKHVRY